MKKTFYFLLLITFLFGLLTSITAHATTYHVKTNGSDVANGTTWATAYATLQKALSVASTGDQIWVAKGTYYPDEGGSFTDNDPIAAFTMKNGVAIYGGFAGNEASDYDLSLRDFVTNETILSGEIQQDNNDSNNSEHVFYNNFNSGSPLTATAILSGFTVTKGGKTSGSYKGGGMYNNYAHPTLTHCLFSDNKSDFGGGVFNDRSSPALTDCRFFKNQATFIGGGIHNYNTSANPTLTRCAFSENKSVDGAGAGNEYSLGSFINCSFIQNEAVENGGGMYNLGASPVLINCLFSGNATTNSSGGYYGGGGLSGASSGSSQLTNCVFSGNKATNGEGGGLHFYNCSAVLTNCSIAGNYATFYGGGIRAISSNLTLANCIVWGNGANPVNEQDKQEVYGIIPTYTNSLVKGLSGSGLLSGDQNPLFISQPDFNAAPTAAGDLRLRPCSPAINIGNDADNNTATDVANNDRTFGTIDLGAYEYQGTSPTTFTFTVNNLGDDPDATPGDGICATAGGVCTLRAAIMETNALTACSPLTINFSVNGIIQLGGVLPDITHPNLTIQGPGAALLTVSRNTGGEYRLFNFVGNGTATVSALTLTNGNSTGFGGAVRANPAALTLNDCIITGNYAATGGGISAAFGGLLTINRCIISNNTASQAAGIYIQDKNALIQNSIIRNNQASDTGGLRLNAFNTDCSMTLINTLVSGNTSTNQESAMRSEGVAGRTATINLTNCTVTNNSTTNAGQPGAIWQRPGGPTHVLNLTNTIVTGNTSNGIPSDFTATLSPSSSNNLVGVGSGLTHGTNGNLVGVNPLFVDVPNGNFHLLPCSPAINAGNDADNATLTDLAGNNRKFGQIDLGAFETQSTASNLTRYVKTNGSDLANGTSWATAFATLQKALQYTCPGDQIWVAAGTYYPDEGGSFANNNRNAAFTMKNNLAIYGGFAGTEATLNDRVATLIHTTNKTTLSGDIDQNDGADFSNTASNAYHLFFNNNSSLNSTAILDGFTVTAANANGNSNPIRWGAGMYNEFASPTVSNCIFTGNQAIDYGGGIYNFGVSSPVITNCVFSGNKARLAGSGVYNFSSSPMITNCIFSGNHGAALVNQFSSAVLTNCTFSGNYSVSNGGAIVNISATPTLRNCILWGNSSEVSNDSSTPFYSNTLIQVPNAGSFQPRFVNQPDFNAAPTTTGNLRLLPCSPAINAGVDADNSTTVDLDFNPRKFGVIDLGAYENQGNEIVTTISAPTVTQPTCAAPTSGSIVVNAAVTTGNTLEYSINNGTDWQPSATFSGLPWGSYTLKVRLQATPSCETSYGSNPVVLASPFSSTTIDTWTGCISTDWATPGNWQDGSVPTATDNVTIPNVTNDPIISAPAVAKSVTVQSGAGLTNNSTLTINGSTTQGMLNTGTVQNNGTLAIGTTSNVGLYGLYNQAIFNNNNGGQITIDRSTSDGLVNDNNGTVTNLGTIDIGGAETVGAHGIRNQADFDNNAGQININRAARGLLHQTGTFNNAAGITIGGIGGIGDIGLLNLTTGTFNNNSGGQINIDRSTFAGIINQGNTFNNAGVLTIGSGASVGQCGLQNNANGSFNNNPGGEINIDRSTGTGLDINSGSFTNLAKITIGAVGSVGSQGINNAGTFNNNSPCSAVINIVSNNIISNAGTFNNAGIIIENATGTSSISTNTGVVQNLNGGTFTIGSGNAAIASAGDIWTGCTSTDWNTATNWLDGSVPTASDDVTIPDVTNDPIISTAALAKSVTVQSGALLTITITSSLTINGSVSPNNTGLLNLGTVDNSGLISIGNTSAVEGNGLLNGGDGVFNNYLGGSISINRSSSFGGVNNSGTFTNAGTIIVGDIAISSQDNIENYATFINTVTGIISVDRAQGNGIWNIAGTFQNNGKITVGSIATTGTGILSTAPFTNSATAQIHIDQVANGIASTNAFTNAGLIRMGENGPLTGSGIANVQGANAVFNNNAGGDISIKQTAVDGLQNDANSTFNNNACAKLTIFDNLNNAGTFTNAGLFTVNTAQAHTNSSLTNNGIIDYPQGNPIPNVTNNDLIANSVSGCLATVTNALQIGGMNSFTVGTAWYKDQALTQPAGTYDQNTNTFTASGLTVGNTYQLYFSVTDLVNMCARTVSIPLTLNPLSTASILNNNSPICTASNAVFTVNGTNGATLTYTLTGLAGNQTLLLDGSNQTITANNAATDITLTLVSGTKNNCPVLLSATATVRINAKPTITLSVNGQTFNEGNSATICDTDANSLNPLQFTVTGSCLVGNPVWRVQAGNGAWSNWSSQTPVAQSSDNQAYKYQAACDGACPSTYTTPPEVTINYRASTPQNVSLTADGTTLAAGESKTICNLEGNTLAFNATCAAGEILLYSVDGGDYSTNLPSQIVDNTFHNYRVRCRKADNTPSCVETESAVMSLKITTSGPAPAVSITPTSSCGTPTAFSGSSNCGALTTIWYNAATNQALPTLPTSTPNATTSFYARCQNEAGCLSEIGNTVTFTITPVNEPPVVSASAEIVCTGTPVTISANCPNGSTAFWNTGVTTNSFQVAFSNVTQQSYWAKCIFPNGCQSPESSRKTILWKAFELTFINIGQSQSATKPANDRNLWSSQFITKDAGPVLENSTEANPTIYYSENVNKTAPRFWTIQTETCALGTDGSVTYDMLAAPEVGVVRSYNTHENNAPYLMYANREGFTELYAQNHPAYGFYQDNGSGGNVYDTGLPKGLYKLGIRYWDQKGQGSIYPSTRQPAGNVLAYQEYWFRIQSQNGVGTGTARLATDNGQRITDNGAFAQVMPNPVSQTLHLKINEAKGQKVNVSLVDVSGRTMLQRAFVPQTHQHQEEFEVSQLVNGMYFLRVNTVENQATLKVVKVQ